MMSRHLLFSLLAGLFLLSPLQGYEVETAEDLFDLDRKTKASMEAETRLALEHIQSYHYTKKSLARVDSEELLTSYMADLDYSRLFFLESDKEEILLRFEETLKPVYLSRGDLFPAFEVFEIYRDRALSRLEWVFDRLEGEFDFSTDETYRPDRSEMDWPVDMAEADSLWERRLKYDLLQEILADQTIEQAKEKVRRRYTRSQKFIRDIEPFNVQETFLTAFAHLYDPHSNFLSWDSLEEFSISMRNSLVGIGALLRDEDGFCVLQELIAGGPAELSGQLHPGDKIVEVAQTKNGERVDVIDMKLRKIVNMIRGEKGTEVQLTVIPADASDPSERKLVRLIRDEIKLTANLAKAEVHTVPLSDSRSVAIGVIDLPSFYGAGLGEEGTSSTTEDVEELLHKLTAVGVEGIVLDLRRNGGGLLSEAISLTGLFIPRGPVVQVRDTLGRVREDWDRDPKVAYEGPLAVLVSRRSASASEIVAGALQNHRRAIIIGDSSTHGKGTVQAIFELAKSVRFNPFAKAPQLGATKVTIQKFYLPNGDSTQNEGVSSDITIPSINDFLPIGESDLDNALVWDSIDPLEWDPDDSQIKDGPRIDQRLIERLRDRSAQRLETLDEFRFLKEHIAWFKDRQEREEIPLNLELRREQREADKAFKEEMDKRREDLAADHSFPVEEVLLNVSVDKEAQHQTKLLESRLPDGREKVNQYYQKVFYYQPEADGKVHEVFIEDFDFEKIEKSSTEIATAVSEDLGMEIGGPELESLFQHLKNADRSEDFLIKRVLPEYVEAINAENVDAVITAFLTELIEYDPRVLETRPQLDIALRESLRVISDWIVLDSGASVSESNRIAASIPEGEKEEG